MSAKFYGWYRLPRDTDLAALARDLRARSEPVYRELALHAIAFAALLLASDPADGTQESDTERLDAVLDLASSGQLAPGALSRTLSSMSLFAQAAAIVDAVQPLLTRDGARRVPPVFDLIFSVSFLSDPAPTERSGAYTYARPYTDRPEFEQVWAATPGVEPFGYWNNTDPDPDVDPADWEERGRVFDRIVGTDAPAKYDVSWEYAAADLDFEALAQNNHIGTERWLTIDAALDWLATIASNQDGFADQRTALAERFAGPALDVTDAPGPPAGCPDVGLT